MSPLGWIIGSTVLISLLAWLGTLTLSLNDELLDQFLLVLVALAAGGLIGGARSSTSSPAPSGSTGRWTPSL
jgi:zinc and cadmium transporter